MGIKHPAAAADVRGVKLSTPFVAAVLAAVAVIPATADASRRSDLQYTTLISRSYSGKMPNGPSTHPVISNDKRYARAIAFESLASNIVRGDTNGVQDVFAILRKGPIGNNGSPRGGSPPGGISAPA